MTFISKWQHLLHIVRGKPLPFTNTCGRYARYSIGDWTYGYPKVLDWSQQTTLTIGRFCSIGGDVTIFLGGNHRTDFISSYPLGASLKIHDAESRHLATKGDVIIGNDVWIGDSATILSGVTIGDGAVVGACSVVTQDVQPYEIVAGNPARAIGRRFSQETVERLLTLRWWDWPPEKIRQFADVLQSPDVDRLKSLVATR